MRKLKPILTVFVAFALVTVFVACGGGNATAVKGNASLLKMIPENAVGVFVVNFDKIAKLDVYQKALDDMVKESDDDDKIFENYEDFVAKTGIDLKKDLHGVAIGVCGALGGTDAKVVALMNLNYDKARILNIFAMQKKEVTTDKYEDMDIHHVTGDDGKDVYFSFVSDSLVALANGAHLNQALDVISGKAKSVLENPKKKAYLEQFDPNAVFSYQMDLPEKVKNMPQQGSPFKFDLTKAEMITGFVNYTADMWQGEMKMIALDEAANKQMVSVLNGFKGMAGMAGPEVAELVSNITLTAAADHVKMEFKLTNELLKKLQEKAKEKAKKLEK